MKEALQRICRDYLINKDAAAKAFKFEIDYIYPVCANILCSHGRVTDAETLRQCGGVVKESTGLFSNFRGNIRPVLASMLALSDSPAEQMEQAKEYYALLKKDFFGTEYLALASFLLTRLVPKYRVEEMLPRSRVLYNRMKKEHPFLTGSEDSVFAVLLAFSEKPDDALIADMEACYTALRSRFMAGDNLQTASHVLSMTEGSSTAKAERLIALFDALREAGIKYGKSYELAVLAALSLSDVDIPTLTAEIGEVDAFLRQQKGYGLLGFGKQQRAMHAAMLVSDQYMQSAQMDSASMASALAMIIAEEIAMCAIAATVASSASSSH